MDLTSIEEESPMLNAVVDYKNRPALRTNSGGFRSAAYIISTDYTMLYLLVRSSFIIIVIYLLQALRFWRGSRICANLITYLTGPLGQSTAVAAVNVNVFNGAGMLLPLLGALVADTFLGRFRTIVFASLLYILGLGLLTLSTIIPSLLGSNCETDNSTSCLPPLSQVVLFFSSLYLVAIAQGGHKPCTQAFGADQFDCRDPLERQAQGSFFNWWYFGVSSGVFTTNLIVVYVQDNLSWSLGFGIPCAIMVIALTIFLLGTTTYRYAVSENQIGPFSRIGRVFVATIRNRRAISSSTTTIDESSEQLKFLNKALIKSNECEEDNWACSISEVEEAKAVVRLIPIWTTCLIYGIVDVKTSTFFTKQGVTMERTIVPGLEIPPASLQCLVSFTIITLMPIYDCALVPILRTFTGKPLGITVLQRIGTGLFISVFSMIVAALVEIKRLKIVEEFGLFDEPNATLPMSVWWLVPQYFLIGIMEVFTMVGLQEFFYDQVPIELRSIGIALYLSVLGAGNFLSSFLVSFIEKVTSGDGRDSWFNKARLDYFYFLLAGLSALGFASFFHFSRLYVGLYNMNNNLIQSLKVCGR